MNNLKVTILDSRAKNTVCKYTGGFKRFIAWIQSYPEISSVLPCKEIHVGLYLQHLTETAKHFSTIETAMYSIKWAHNLAGLMDPCDSEFIRNIRIL